MAKHRRPYCRLSSPEGCRQDPARRNLARHAPGCTHHIPPFPAMPQPPSIAPKLWDDESALWDVFPVQRWYLRVLPRPAVSAIITYFAREESAMRRRDSFPGTSRIPAGPAVMSYLYQGRLTGTGLSLDQRSPSSGRNVSARKRSTPPRSSLRTFAQVARRTRPFLSCLVMVAS